LNLRQTVVKSMPAEQILKPTKWFFVFGREQCSLIICGKSDLKIGISDF
jgi:hypothetical protein